MTDLETHVVGIVSVVVISLLLAGCRYETVWSGADYDASGKYLRVAADEPFCGCLQIVNVAKFPVTIRSLAQRRIERGRVTLQPGEVIKEKFDWSGPDGDDYFILDAFTVDNPAKAVLIRDVIRRVDIGWPFQPCELVKCDFGPLYMNTGGLQPH